MTRDSRTSSGADTDSTGSRWSELKALFDSAILLDASERQTFIERRCADDGDLREELESLLKAYDETGDFLEQPLAASLRSLADTAFPGTQTDDPQIGSRIGAYRLERQIGRGGMGAVYLATRADSEFVKRVAIKVIRHGKDNAFAVSRFRNERQILARLENQYVARLIDGGTTEAGLPYFVMEYVEGQPVTKYCDAESLTTRDRLHLFLKICTAVRYAHERNIIHRDLKPSNILVKQDGTPKLLDFGIAKIIGDLPGVSNEATMVGFRLLTPAYASPEQMRGDPPTVRSDVYSLGVILYELLCGERPSLSTFQLTASPLERPQEAHLSLHLRSIVFNAIRWDPNERYPSVAALAGDIERYLGGLPPISAAGPPLEIEATPSQISIAILPFRALGSPDTTQDFLASGIGEALIARLSRVERVSVRPSSAVLKYAERHDTPRAAKELRVKYLLEGSVHVLDDQVRVGVQLVFAEAGIAVWAAQFDERKTDILKLEDLIAEQVAYALVPQLTGEEREQVSRSGTANGQAHEAYLRGRWHWSRSAENPEELAKALVGFMQAIALDPNYARAHAGLADYYLRLGLWGGLPPSESFAAAIESAEAAVRLDCKLGEAHASLAFAIWAYHRDYEAAEKHFNLAIIRNPAYASAHHWFGLLNSARNRPELAIANLERARKIDPNSPAMAAALGFVHYNARQYERAIQVLLEAGREMRNGAGLQEILTWSYLQIGDLGKALEAARANVEISNRSPASLCALAHAEAASRNREGAATLVDEIEKIAQQRQISAYDRASAFLANADHENAIRCLERACADRDWWVTWIAVDPRWDPLRNDPRFTKLVVSTQRSKTVEVAAADVSRTPRADRWRAAAFAGVCLIAVFACCLAWFLHSRTRPAPFLNSRVTKLTSNGTAEAAAISPDGKYVGYMVAARNNNGLFLRDLSSSRTIELASHLTGAVMDPAFTGSGKEVSFIRHPLEQPSSLNLFVVPTSGGVPPRLVGTFPGPVSLSGDGSQAAWFKSNALAGRDELWLTSMRTGTQRMLVSYKHPERFASMPAWSPDRKLIAYALERRDQQGFLVSLYAVEVATGSARPLRSPRWDVVQRIAWLGDRSGLAVIGQEHDSAFQQPWYVPYGRGESKRIATDLNHYDGVSVTANNSALVSVQEQMLSNVYILNPSDPAHPIQITPGSGRYYDLSWTPDGHILYSSDATGSADLWMMNADGTGQHQITFGLGRSYAAVASPDGKLIAFHSNRSGNWQVWRANADGSNATQLSASARDANWPQFTPDGKFVIFHQSDSGGAYHLWKVSSNGGRPVQITKSPTMHPAVSPKDGKIVAWYSETSENPRWKLALFSPDGGEPLRVFDPIAGMAPDSPLRWHNSGDDAFTFIDFASAVPNIWLQLLDGRPPRPLTTFSWGQFYAYDWSRDGKLVYAHGLTTADVVLIKDTTASRQTASR
jgi:eukaryotic-like serine/threonine-protein kinase